MNAEWLDILSKVRSGELSVEEAAVRLEVDRAVRLEVDRAVRLEGSGPEESVASGETAPEAETGIPPAVLERAVYEPAHEDIQPELGWWTNAWLALYWIGTGVIVLSAVLMGWAYTGSKSFWMFCSWLPMLLGILTLGLGWWSRQARWFHVRIQEAAGGKVSISAPLPLSLASWFLRVFGPRIPSLREKHMDDLHLVFDALEEAEGPITIEVDDKDGDRVRVYIL